MASSQLLPAACSVAPKEWAVVIQAMGDGRQIVMVRKGGLVEPSGGFSFQSDVFLLYPTFEHQAVQYALPEYQSLSPKLAAERREGWLRLAYAGRLEASIETHDGEALKRLRDLHVYTDGMITQRLRWQPQQPLVIGCVRVFRLREPWELPMRDAYAGCKSWVDLGTEASLGGAEPVLSDAAFAQRLEAFKRGLQTPAS